MGWVHPWVGLGWVRVVHGSILITHDPTQPTDIQIQPNPTHCQVNLWTHDPTQPTKNKKFRPIPNPTQPNPRVNPTHGQLWVQLPITPENLCHAATTTAAVVVLAVEQNRHLSLKERRKERLKSQCPATAPYPNSYTYGRHGLALQRPMEYSH